MSDVRPDRADKQITKLFCITIALVLAAIIGLPGCSEHDHEHGGTDQHSTDSDGKVVHVYHLRGRIVSLPDPADPASEFRIHHEAIDDFKMGDGSPSPMNAMKMPFTPGDDVDIDSLAVGDVIAFEFHVEWEPGHGMTAKAIEKLPADTKLSFEKANEQSADHADH